jgi:HAD superfamily hydrolase (TIGR01484 family)
MQINYRGYLKSCNYQCGYCPFSKNKLTKQALIEDEKQLNTFVNRILAVNSTDIPSLKILFTPYGEGLIHAYYQEAMIRLSHAPFIEAVSIQTNFSLNAHLFSARLIAQQVDLSKIKLWASFHPTEISLEKFIDNYDKLDPQIQVTFGAVAHPQQIRELKNLKQRLKPNDYLFLNAMNGFKRAYTSEEIAQFTAIDPFFIPNPKAILADETRCVAGKSHFFVHHTGDVSACNLSRIKLGSLDNLLKNNIEHKEMRCASKSCDCFLAYSTRKDYPMRGPLKTLRIPRAEKIKMLFLDLDGTLLDKNGQLSEEKIATLQKIHAKNIHIGIATSRPFHSLKSELRCYPLVWKRLFGVVCSDGAEVIYFKSKMQWLTAIEMDIATNVMQFISDLKWPLYKIYTSKQGAIYKILLKNTVSETEINSLCVKFGLKAIKDKQYIGLTHYHCSKTTGIKKLASLFDCADDDIVVVGNGDSDLDMLNYFNYSIAVMDAEFKAKAAAKYNLDFSVLDSLVNSIYSVFNIEQL